MCGGGAKVNRRGVLGGLWRDNGIVRYILNESILKFKKVRDCQDLNGPRCTRAVSSFNTTSDTVPVRCYTLVTPWHISGFGNETNYSRQARFRSCMHRTTGYEARIISARQTASDTDITKC